MRRMRNNPGGQVRPVASPRPWTMTACVSRAKQRGPYCSSRDLGPAERWTPGEIGASKQLKQFGKHGASYPTGRDRPDRVETSRLSPHLHFGEIGPRQIVAMLRHSSVEAAQTKGTDSYLRQIGWREFAHRLDA